MPAKMARQIEASDPLQVSKDSRNVSKTDLRFFDALRLLRDSDRMDETGSQVEDHK